MTYCTLTDSSLNFINMSDYWTGLLNYKPNMNKEMKDKLTMILFWQNVAGTRNVKPIDRLEALHKDIAEVILGASKADCAQASCALTKAKESI